MKNIYLILMSLFCITALSNPTFRIKDFSTNDGLNGVVQSMTQDAHGMMWLASWNGLVKYDGYDFKYFKSHVGDGSTQTTNKLISVQRGWNGNLWCLSYDNRVYLYDVHNEYFIDVLRVMNGEMKRRNRVKTVYPLADGITWLACEGGVAFRVDEKRMGHKGYIKYYGTYNGSLHGNIIYDIRQDGNGGEWILTDEGTTILGKRKMTFGYPFRFMTEDSQHVWLITRNGILAAFDKHYRKLTRMTLNTALNEVNGLWHTPNGKLVISHDNGITFYSPNTGSVSKMNAITIGKTAIMGIDHNGNIWYEDKLNNPCRYDDKTGVSKRYFTIEGLLPATDKSNVGFMYEYHDGLVVVIPHNGVLGYYDSKTDRLVPIEDNGKYIDFAVPYVDRQENLWFSSQLMFGKLTVYNRNFTFTDLKAEVRCLFFDSQHRLWIATKDGKVRIRSGNSWNYLDSNGRMVENETSFGQNVYGIIQAADGSIWMGTRKNGLYILAPNGKVARFRHDANDRYSLSNDNIFHIMSDSHGRVWIATYGGGINMVQNPRDISQLKFVNMSNSLIGYPKNDCREVRYIYESHGVIMACTTDGLITFPVRFKNAEDIHFYHNSRTPDNTCGLSDNNVMSAYSDSRGNIYVMQYNGTISRVASHNLLSDKIRFWNFKDRENEDIDLMLSAIEDSRHCLWMFMERGIAKYDSRTNKVITFGNNFFNKDFKISDAQPVINQHGDIILGTSTGMLTLSTANLRKSSYKPGIVITQVSSQGSAFKPYRYEGTLTLMPDERSFTVKFAALDYQSPADIRYEYRLKGLSDNWHYADKNREVNYVNIPNGDYEFQVRSTNSDGVWLGNTTTLPIHVKPTFWETPWAWILYLLAACTLIIVIVYIFYYIYNLRHQMDVETQLTDVKLRFFTDISHELRTPLTLIQGPVEEVLKTEKMSDGARQYLETAKNNIDHTMRLISQILDFRKIQNNMMKLFVQEIEIVGFLHQIADNFNTLAQKQGQRYVFDTNVEQCILWADRDKTEKIFYNLISNAFKYTPANRSIRISIEKHSGHLSVQVADEGIGISPSKINRMFQRFESFVTQNQTQPSSGIGLSLVKNFVELHHAAIDVQSNVGSGSVFTVTFKLGKAHFIGDKRAEFILADSASCDTGIEIQKQEIDTNPQLRILIVEDNRQLASFLHNVLGTEYQIIEAEDGAAGLKAARGQMPDIIITDIMMPVMDGMQMIQMIKSDKNICHIPIVALTAKDSLDDRIAGIGSGVDDYIVKPFSTSYLKARIESILKQRQSLQEYYKEKISGRDERMEKMYDKMPEPHPNNMDDEFVNALMEFVNTNIENSELTIDQLASHMLMSRSTFYTKLRAVTGLAPIEFLMRMRINYAAKLIKAGGNTISQVAYMCGFSDAKYFSKCFKRFHGVSPSEYK